MDVPHYWTADQVQRLLDSLAADNHHQARTAALIMWRTGLRISEVLELEWRDLDYAGEPATLLVRRSKTRKARTVRMHPELVQLFTNWPANRTPRDKVVPLAMRTVLRHIADAVVASGLEEESPGTGKRRPGAHSLRHSAARHWLMGGEGAAERGVGVPRKGRRTNQLPDHSRRCSRGERCRSPVIRASFTAGFPRGQCFPVAERTSH